MAVALRLCMIVCGTDFSNDAKAAVQAAAALSARIPDQELRLVHVLDPSLQEHVDSADCEKIRAKAGARLDAEGHRVRDQFGLGQLSSTVLVGPTSDALSRLAEAEHAAFLVVGSQGHGASPLYKLGGASERLAVAAAVPVLVVRDGAPFEAWSRGERPLRVLLGVDWSSSSRPAVHLVKMLRSAGPCEVIVTHVYYPEEVAIRYGLPSLSWIEPNSRAEELLARDFAKRVGELGGAGKVSFQPKIGMGRLGDHLLEVAETEKSDLVVVGTHHRRGLRRLSSVSSVVLHFGHASVACAPAGETLEEDEATFTVRRVLIPTDLSHVSNHAIRYGYGLLAECGGEVHLLHVAAPDRNESAADRDPELVARLRAIVPVWAEGRNIVTRTEVVRSNDAGGAICRGAARLGADVVCMGTHGRSGLGRAVLGSVTEKVIRESQRPVLVVRPPPA